MFDTYELQDTWLKVDFEKAATEGEANGTRRLLRDLLASRGITPNHDTLESADAARLRAWAVDLFRGTRPDVLCQR